MCAMHDNRIPPTTKCRCDRRADRRALIEEHTGQIIHDPARQAGVGFHDETPYFQGCQKRLHRQDFALIQFTPGKAGSVCSFHS